MRVSGKRLLNGLCAMLGIDTNVLVRLIVKDDAAQAKLAAAYLRRHCSTDNPGFISLSVAVELFWTLSRTYQLGREEVAKAIHGILISRELIFQHPDEVRYAFRMFVQEGADFADALIGAVNQSEGCFTTVTFDKNASRLPEFTLLRKS